MLTIRNMSLLPLALLLVGTMSILGCTSDIEIPTNEQETESSSTASASDTGGFVKQEVMDGRSITLPEGLEIKLFATGLGKPRFFDVADDGTVYVTDITGNIFVLKDEDGDGVSDRKNYLDEGLRSPHGIDWYEGDLYVGEEHQVVVYRNVHVDGTYLEKEILVRGLPSGGGHVTRTVQIHDGKLYVSVGSSCNLCEESNEKRAAILRYNLHGTGEQVIAKGLRNAVGFVFEDDQLWATDNGRDLIGDGVPPEEIDVVEEGKHYGWPYCHGNGIAGPEYPGRAEFCENETEDPTYVMQAHSAPLGLTFAPGSSNLPRMYRNGLFVALHGSWNRSVPTGYKIIWFDTSERDPKPQDFITGWLLPDGSSWGRPVGVGFTAKGEMLISDDKAGVLYVVRTAE